MFSATLRSSEPPFINALTVCSTVVPDLKGCLIWPEMWTCISKCSRAGFDWTLGNESMCIFAAPLKNMLAILSSSGVSLTGTNSESEWSVAKSSTARDFKKNDRICSYWESDIDKRVYSINCPFSGLVCHPSLSFPRSSNFAKWSAMAKREFLTCV